MKFYNILFLIFFFIFRHLLFLHFINSISFHTYYFYFNSKYSLLKKLRKQSDHIDYIEPNIVMKTSEIQEEMEPIQQGQECATQEDVLWVRNLFVNEILIS